jgi:hypothetical protein
VHTIIIVIINAEVVTRRPIEAHSSNGGHTSLRDESTKRAAQTWLGADHLSVGLTMPDGVQRPSTHGADT